MISQAPVEMREKETVSENDLWIALEGPNWQRFDFDVRRYLEFAEPVPCVAARLGSLRWWNFEVSVATQERGRAQSEATLHEWGLWEPTHAFNLRPVIAVLATRGRLRRLCISVRRRTVPGMFMHREMRQYTRDLVEPEEVAPDIQPKAFRLLAAAL